MIAHALHTHEYSHTQLPNIQVRFFERVKLERRIKKLQAKLSAAQGGTVGPAGADAASTGNMTNGSGAGGAGEVAQLEAALAAAREDLEYVLHFPKAEKYVSILRQADTAEAQVRSAAAECAAWGAAWGAWIQHMCLRPGVALALLSSACSAP